MAGVKGRSGPQKSLGTQINESMQLLDKELPALITKLIEKAEGGDREALIYLIDRRMGKPRQQTDLTVEGGEQLGAGLVVELFKLLAQKRRELLEEGQDERSVTEGTDTEEGRALQE